VDNHHFQRLIYEVLNHNPTEQDITRFFQRFQDALTRRRLSLKGITTDGSSLYPGPIAQVFGPVRHPLCEFHVIAELNKAVLKAVSKVRRQLKATLPKLDRGRPAKADRKRAARKKRIEAKISDLFDHRCLLVQHHLTAAERKTLQRITRGRPQLRTLRQIVDEVYRLSTAAAGPTPRWPSWLGCAGGSPGSRSSARHSRSCSRRTWTRP